MKQKLINSNRIKIALFIDNHTNGDGKNQIYLRVYKSGKYTFIRTGKFVKPKFWDKKSKAVKNVKGNHGATKMIADLDEMKMQLRRIVDDFIRDEKAITKKALESALFQTDQTVESITLRQVLERSVKEDKLDPDVSQRTIDHYEMVFKQVNEFFPDKLIADFSRKDVEAIRAHWTYEKHLSKKSVYGYLTSLKKPILKAVRKWGLLEKNPFDGLKLRKVQYSKREFLTAEELNRLHSIYVSRKFEGIRFAPNSKYTVQEILQFFLAGCYTGLRYNDLRKIDDREQYFVGDVIRIFCDKPQKWVTIPILPQLRGIIRPFGSKVFDKVQDCTHTATYNSNLQRVLKLCGIDRHFSAHCSRHTFACVALEVGISMEVIQAILGHSDIRVTQIYATIQGKTVKEEMEKFKKLEFIGKKGAFRRVV